jgi:CRISPR system Cascade subunit CasE
MFLARLRLNHSRVTMSWAANPYRVHQRLMMAFEGEDRLLFRIEQLPEETQILIQSHIAPHWDAAFADFAVLDCPPECKTFAPLLEAGRCYRFRLRANPTVKRDGKRLGLFGEEEQRAWLSRKLRDAGTELLECVNTVDGLQRVQKNPRKDATVHTHFAVLFEGTLRARDPAPLAVALESGIGSAKGYGFGLLSLAPAPK